MEKLIESLKSVHPGKYELRMKELDYLYDTFHHDTFKLGFARGQKAVKNA